MMETIQLLTHVFVKITHGEILELIVDVNGGVFMRVAVLGAGIAGLLAGSLHMN